MTEDLAVAAAGRRAVAAAFADVPPDDADALLAAATHLLDDIAWLDQLLAPLIAAVAADHHCDIALKVNRDAHRCGAILYRQPGVTLTLSQVSAAGVRAAAAAPSVICSGKLSVTRYIRAGGATLLRWAAPPPPEPLLAAAIGDCRRLPDRTLHDGAVVRHDGRAEAQLLRDADRDLVMLTVTIDAGADPVAREYDRRSGRCVRMATNDEGAARSQLLLSLLRASGRPVAAAFSAATRDGAFFLRWSAMREWLACDWRAAWPRLSEMAAADPHPEVRATAAATLDALQRRAA